MLKDHKGITILLAVSSFILSYFLIDSDLDEEELSKQRFKGFVGSFLIGWFLYCFETVVRNYSDISNRFDEPIFYSPWLFPVYKIDNNNGYIKSNNNNTSDIIKCFFVIYIFGFMVSAYITPKFFGVFISSISQTIFGIWYVWATTLNSIELGKAYCKKPKSLLTQDLINKAWIEAKEKYVEMMRCIC